MNAQYRKLANEATSRGVRIRIKEKAYLMWFLYYAILRFLAPDFMSNYATTIGRTVYIPEKWIDTTGGYITLRHELVHVAQWDRWWLLFMLLYLGPLPIGPLNMRWYWEFEAFRESMRAMKEVYGSVTDDDIAFFCQLFTGPTYAWMFPFPRLIKRMFEDARNRLP